MNRFCLVILAIVSLSCVSTVPAPKDSIQEPATVSDNEIGLVKGSLFEEPDRQAIPFNEIDAGESELRARSYPSAPPVIPHGVAGLELITADENQCIDCHAPDVAEDMGAVPIPESHFVDLRNAPEEKLSDVAGVRYNCTLCHVAQTLVEPLVGELGS